MQGNSNLAIIILNYENYKLTNKCVNNLMDLSLKYNIIIVDNDSKNNSYEILKETYKNVGNIDVIRTEKNGGYAYGNNLGIKEAKKQNKDLKYFCIMNPDVIITYDIFKNLIEKMESNPKIALMGALMILNNKLNLKNVTWDVPNEKEIYWNNLMFTKNKNKYQELEVNEQGIAYVDVVPGSFFVANYYMMEEINYFDEGTFLYNEENILAIKLEKKKYLRALSVGDYYFHNHEDIKKTKEQILNINQIGYKSREHLCNKYYEKGKRRLKLTYQLNKLYIHLRFLLKK